MTVVSNSSPLIALARIGQLDLLQSLYGRVAIPSEVHREVVVAGAGMPGAAKVGRASWIEVRPVQTRPPVQPLTKLGLGEWSAILLGKEIDADMILLDERKARRVAQAEGLNVIGCIGVLEHAYRRNLIDPRLAYEDLLKQGIRFDLRILQQSLANLGLPPL